MATVDRLLSVLNLFTFEKPDWSVEDASAELAVPSSTTYRYFSNLTRAGLLSTAGNGRYILGPAIIRYDRQLRLTDPLVRAARAEMERLAEFVSAKGVVFLTRLFGDQVMCIAQAARGDPPFSISYERGRLMPLFAGSASRVILANMPAAKVKSLHHKHAPEFAAAGMGTDWSTVRESLKAARAQGAVSTIGEVDPGMRGTSVPVVLASRVEGSLSIAGPRQGFSSAMVGRLIEELTVASRRIVEELHRLEIRTA